jgi:hypothetical protein
MRADAYAVDVLARFPAIRVRRAAAVPRLS